MVHWVYVLKSSQTGAIYVGETNRLYRRWNEHRTGRGGVTTSMDNYDTLIGLYNVAHNSCFIDYFKVATNENRHDWSTCLMWDEDDLDKMLAREVENHITERYIYDVKHNVKGGKYCRDGCVVDISRIVLDRPLCKCGYPCEVNMKKDQTKIYYTCPVPDWTDFDDIETPDKCNYWKEYEPYRTLRELHNQNRREDYAERMRKPRFELYNELTKDD